MYKEERPTQAHSLKYGNIIARIYIVRGTATLRNPNRMCKDGILEPDGILDLRQL